MDEIIGISASAAGGGLFGLLGTTLGRVAGFFEKRQSIAHEERRWQHETALAELQQKTAMQAAKTAMDQAHVDGSWEGLSASLAAQAAIGDSYKWVNAIRSLTRPSLTLLLWGIATLIWFSADSAAQANIVETATFAATAATLWWFGDRAATTFRAP
ncbi:MAG: hypothetical protein AAGA89_02395 [Pseudomonadota bacterium]